MSDTPPISAVEAHRARIKTFLDEENRERATRKEARAAERKAFLAAAFAKRAKQNNDTPPTRPPTELVLTLSLQREREEPEETEAERKAREASQLASVIADIRERFPGTRDGQARWATREEVIRAGITDDDVEEQQRAAPQELTPRAWLRLGLS